MTIRQNAPRWFAGIVAATILLLGTISMADKKPELTRWRRTAHGWVSNLQWEGRQAKLDPPPVANVHPTLIAGLLVLLSVGGLLYFDQTKGRAVDVNSDGSAGDRAVT